jgi:hypothetical protein
MNYVPAKVTTQTWRSLTRRTPFVGIGWDAIEAGDNTRVFNGQSRWTVFLATKNASGIMGRYFGDALAPGLFTMTEVATAALQGWTIPGIGSAAVTRGSNVFIDGWDEEEMVVSTLDVSIGVTIKLGEAIQAEGDDDYFDRIAIDWNFGAATVLSDLDEVRAV